MPPGSIGIRQLVELDEAHGGEPADMDRRPEDMAAFGGGRHKEDLGCLLSEAPACGLDSATRHAMQGELCAGNRRGGAA